MPEQNPPGAPASAAPGAELSLELYKSLRAECAGYLERIPGLWWQKFVLIGAIVAFAFAGDLRPERLPGAPSDLIVVSAICLIPLLAVLVDAKMLEYGLHARAISLFIADHFREPEVLALWERTLWSATDVRSPVVVRSALTVLVTVLPTIAVTIVAAMLVGTHTGSFRTWLMVGLLLSAIYVLLTVGMCVLIWRQATGKAAE